LQRLLREHVGIVAGCSTTTLAQAANPDAPARQVTRYFAAYNLVCGPWWTTNDHLLGAVTVDTCWTTCCPPAGGNGRIPGKTGYWAGHGANDSSMPTVVSDA